MYKLSSVTPLAHDPWHCQVRLTNYYTRVLEVTIGLHIENDITSENTMKFNRLIVIIF